MPTEPTTAPRNLRRILVVAMLPLLLALFAVVVIAVRHADLSGPRQLPKEQLDELPANLDIVTSVESCGQGRRPVDCGAVVIIAGNAELDETAVNRRGTQCVVPRAVALRRGRRWSGSRLAHELWGRQDSVQMWVGSTRGVPEWADDRVLIGALERGGRAWVVLHYSSVRGS